MLAIQGPHARAKAATVDPRFGEVGRFRVERFDYDGVEVRVAGTGYTGEPGLEIAAPNEVAEEIFRALIAAEITPRASARATRCAWRPRFPLRPRTDSTLHHARGGPGLGTRLEERDLSRSRGRGARTRARRRATPHGSRRRPIANRCAMAARCCVEGDGVGTLASGNFSPVLGHGIGMGLLEPGLAPGQPGHGAPAWTRDRGRSRRAALRGQGVVVADYLPHTKDDVASMLEFLGMDSLDDLFAHIPAAVRLSGGLDIEPGLSEPDVAAIFAHLHRGQPGAGDEYDVLRGWGSVRP